MVNKCFGKSTEKLESNNFHLPALRQRMGKEEDVGGKQWEDEPGGKVQSIRE